MTTAVGNLGRASGRASGPAAKLALLGTGYIGGSVALAAVRAGLVDRVTGYDVDGGALEAARAGGVIHDLARSPEEAVADAAFVVLAAPVGALGELARRVGPAMPATALAFDVGSVKADVVRAVDSAIGSGRFVGSHPLAGTERSGPGAADADLFQGRICFLCPGRATAQAMTEARAFWEAIGARVLEMDAERHDTVMAAVSHLPHVAAFSLAASLADHLPQLEASGPGAGATTSLRDTTRIAASNPRVWRDILMANRAHLLPLVAALRARVGELERALQDGDGDAVEQVLTVGRATRDRLVKP